MQRYHYRMVEGLVSTAREYQIFSVGKGVHKYLEMRRAGHTPGVAIPKAQELLKDADADSLKQFMRAINGYEISLLSKFALKFNDLISPQAMEQQFSIPLPEFELDGHIIEIYLQGTIDAIQWVVPGQIIEIVDYKTTRITDISRVLGYYRWSSQFAFYTYILRKYGDRILAYSPEAVEATKLGRIMTHIYPIYVGARTDIKPIQELTPWCYTDTQLNNFESQLFEMLVFLAKVRINNLRNRTGWLKDCCGDCQFNALCYAEPELEEELKAKLFTVRHYDPLRHTTSTEASNPAPAQALPIGPVAVKRIGTKIGVRAQAAGS